MADHETGENRRRRLHTETPSLRTGRVPVDDGELYYETKGKGRPIVFIHAGFLDSRMWDGQFESYSKKFQVVRYDVRGFGRSSRPTDKYSDIEDLNNLLQHLHIEKTVLVGCSNGGRIAIDFAVNHSEKVEGLVLVGSGVSGRTPQSQEEEKIWSEFEKTMALQEDLVKEGRFKESAEMDVNAWASAQNPLSREKLMGIALDNAPVQAENPWQHIVHPTPRGYQRLPDIKTPTLILVGEKDQPGMQLIAYDLHRKIAGSTMVVVDGADHIINMSRPEKFDETVLKFLVSLSH